MKRAKVISLDERRRAKESERCRCGWKPPVDVFVTAGPGYVIEFNCPDCGCKWDVTDEQESS